MGKIKAVLFDWGDTLMRDIPGEKGAMVYWDKVEVLPGVVEMLEEISKKYLCLVVSNAGDSDAELLRGALERGGIGRFIKNAVTSKELNRSKPDPGFFREALNWFELKPENVISVGNDLKKDILPSKSAGIRTVWFAPDIKNTTGSEADAVISSFRELSPVIKRLDS